MPVAVVASDASGTGQPPDPSAAQGDAVGAACIGDLSGERADASASAGARSQSPFNGRSPTISSLGSGAYAVAARRHWRRNLALTAIVLAVSAAVSLLPPFFVETLAPLRVAGMSLAFYLPAQGAIVIYIVLTALYAWLMNRADRRYFAELTELAALAATSGPAVDGGGASPRRAPHRGLGTTTDGAIGNANAAALDAAEGDTRHAAPAGGGVRDRRLR